MAKGKDALRGDESIIDPPIHNDRFPFYSILREEDPVHYDPRLGMYLVSRYEDLQTALRDPGAFSLEKGYAEQYAKGFLEEFKEILIRKGGGFFRDAIMADPPVHTRVRKLLEKAFTAHRVKQLEPRISTVVGEVVERLAERGHGVGVLDTAAPITSRIMCEQLGLDHDEIGTETLQRWSHAVSAQIGRMQTREDMLANAKTMCELQNYIIARIREREDTPREDIISDLVHARADDEENPALTFEEKVSCVRAFIVAANDSTVAAICNLMLILATRPGMAQQLSGAAGDDRLLSRFVEELLRVEPPVHGLSRMTTREVELGGTLLPAGAHILMLFASANVDDKEFPCPREFNMNRENLARHLTFGAGIHRCVGAPLARMEIKVAAREIIRRLDNIKLAIPAEDITYRQTIASHMIERLPLTFTRRSQQS